MRRASKGNRYMIYIRVVCGAVRRHARKAQEQRKARNEYKTWAEAAERAVGSFRKRKSLRGSELPKRI